MMRTFGGGLALCLGAVLIAGACDPGDDPGEPTDTARGDSSLFDPTSASGNLACHLSAGVIPSNDPCVSCLSSRCGDELQAAFGTRGLPTRPGGSCNAFLTCLDRCDCENEDCFAGCLPQADASCQTAVAATQQCQGDECGEACDFDPPGPDGDFCTQAVGVLAAGSAPIQGRLSADDRVGGPEGDAYFDVYTVTLPPSGRLTVGMASDTLDSYLYAYDAGCSELASDDDGGDGFNALLALPDGTAFVIATSLSGERAGAYTLTVTLE
jgi:hypothetical protein